MPGHRSLKSPLFLSCHSMAVYRPWHLLHCRKRDNVGMTNSNGVCGFADRFKPQRKFKEMKGSIPSKDSSRCVWTKSQSTGPIPRPYCWNIVDRSWVIVLLLGLNGAIIIVWCWQILPNNDDDAHRFCVGVTIQDSSRSCNGDKSSCRIRLHLSKVMCDKVLSPSTIYAR